MHTIEPYNVNINQLHYSGTHTKYRAVHSKQFPIEFELFKRFQYPNFNINISRSKTQSERIYKYKSPGQKRETERGREPSGTYGSEPKERIGIPLLAVSLYCSGSFQRYSGYWHSIGQTYRANVQAREQEWCMTSEAKQARIGCSKRVVVVFFCFIWRFLFGFDTFRSIVYVVLIFHEKKLRWNWIRYVCWRGKVIGCVTFLSMKNFSILFQIFINFIDSIF